MTQIVFIRHGETDFNIQRRYCGLSNPSLNDKGREQMRQTATLLQNIPIRKIYSSNLARAHESAQIISSILGCENDNLKQGRQEVSLIEQSEYFCELNFGIFEGLRHDEIIRQYPDQYKRWIDNPVSAPPPEGESLGQLQVRIQEGISSIISSHKNKVVAVITHEGPIKVILSSVLGLDPEDFWRIKQPNGSFSIIDYSDWTSAKVIKMSHDVYSEADIRG